MSHLSTLAIHPFCRKYCIDGYFVSELAPPWSLMRLTFTPEFGPNMMSESTWIDMWGRPRSMRTSRFSETGIVYAVKPSLVGVLGGRLDWF